MTITGLSQRLHAEKADPRWRDRLGSCGYARCGVLVRVVDARDRDVPPGEIGEVVTHSDCVMAGYWQNPEANAETLRGGWLHTGDLGSMDADGLLTLRDRSKDMIISGGSNIYPREIEEVLLRHPDLAEASVVGRPHPEWGEEVIAFVVPRPGTALAAALTFILPASTDAIRSASPLSSTVLASPTVLVETLSLSAACAWEIRGSANLPTLGSN